MRECDSHLTCFFHALPCLLNVFFCWISRTSYLINKQALLIRSIKINKFLIKKIMLCYFFVCPNRQNQLKLELLITVSSIKVKPDVSPKNVRFSKCTVLLLFICKIAVNERMVDVLVPFRNGFTFRVHTEILVF